MPSLPERQRAFGAALLAEADADLLEDFVEAPALAAKRFAAYRRNVLGNWHAALAASFPVLAALIGAGRFSALSEQYRAACPSRNADLNLYPERFAAWLAQQPIGEELPYLADLAQLEWALEEVYGAQEEAALDFTKLEAVPVAQQGAVVLVLASALRAIPSRWPVFEIWQAHQTASLADRDAALAAIFLTPGEHFIVLSRDQAGMPFPQALSAGAAAFFAACRARKNLASALSAALSAEHTLDVGALLADWLARNWIVDITICEGISP